MKEFLAVARGEKPADFVIKGARVANVYTLEYEETDVAVWKNRIAGVGKNYDGAAVVDGKGKTLIPGLIDGHLHIESSMLVPSTFAALVAARGTTTLMPDPHEIANVLGMKGVEYMYLATRGLPVDVFLGAPSCVAASDFESPMEDLEMGSIHEMFARGWCHHLGEVMNFPGVINGDLRVLSKVYAAGGVTLTGHAPTVRGKQLCAYSASGISSDHECTDPDEALEKLRRGMWLMIREGSTRNMESLLPIVKQRPELSFRCMVVSDDISAEELLRNGHLDEKIRLMTRLGLDPIAALRMVTLSPASYFGLKDRGAIAPGLLADMALVSDLESCEVEKVWKNGQLTAEDGKLCRVCRSGVDYSVFREEREIMPLSEYLLGISSRSYDNAELHVIKVEDGSLKTGTLLMRPNIRSGMVSTDLSRDIAKIVVQERHRGTGRFAVGFVSGIGLKKGAIASSVAHDAHNFVAVGMDDTSIVTAMSKLAANGGGLAVTDGADVLGYFALPVAGLMTELDAEQTASGLEDMKQRARELGTQLANPFMTLSFLCLSVIPELKITDKGYVDLTKGGEQPLFTFMEFR